MKISILVPCYNEEKGISSCVRSCLNQTREPDQIVVVNDGSTDRSKEILKKFGSKIKLVSIRHRTGNKSYAQERGLRHITGDILVTTDGDTVLDKDFVRRIKEDFKDPKVVAVGGYVRSIKYNWLTACRAYDYVVGQNIHKLAQSILSFMMVIPGAAGAFRTKIFKKYIGFDHDTLTEDLDFTYKLNKKGFKIKYDRQAIAYTQDPVTLESYTNQMRRWYGGGWQNLIKHLDADLVEDPRRVLEISLVYIEGLVFSLMLFLVPLINLRLGLKIWFFFWLLIVIQTIFAVVKEKRTDILIVPLVYCLVMYINSWVFIEQFFKEVVFRKRNLIWFHPQRVEI